MTVHRRLESQLLVDDGTVQGMLQQIAGDVASMRGDVAAMKTDHALMKQTLGAPSEDAASGTGIVGAVARLETEVRGLTALKNKGRGILIGAIAALAVAVLGLDGALKALAGGVAGLAAH